MLLFDKIIELIIKHEGLIEKQTPFRITHPSMNDWKTIHGFEIDISYPKPENRKNFIFLKNPQDVVKAVKKQFEKYAKNPEKYGLEQYVTIENAIRKFDQTGANNKIKFLIQNIPSLKVDIPLRTILKI